MLKAKSGETNMILVIIIIFYVNNILPFSLRKVQENGSSMKEMLFTYLYGIL